MILVDSSVWIDYFNGVDASETEFLDRALGKYEVAIGDIMLTEVLQGFHKDSDFAAAKRLLTALDVFPLLGEQNAVIAASSYRKLRKKGITVRKTTDVIIATFCIESHRPLLFTDKDFNPFVQHLGLLNALVK